MTIEERVAALEAQLARRREPKSETAYAKASRLCDEHFKMVCAEGQTYGAKFACEQAARSLLKERHQCKGKNQHIMNCIITEDDAQESFHLFAALMRVAQEYLQGSEAS